MQILNVSRAKAIESLAKALDDKTDETLSRLYSLQVDSIDTIVVGESTYGVYQGAIESREDRHNRLGVGRSLNGEPTTFETKEEGIAWISREPVELWILFDVPSGKWIAVNRFPLLGECYDQQGIRHG